jgi:hypothetical protein
MGSQIKDMCFHGIKILEMICRKESIYRSELMPGDGLIIRTRNSKYMTLYLGFDLYRLSGGWFDRHGISPSILKINGCTWGGSLIKIDVVAVRGLRIEFDNGLTTSAILEVQRSPRFWLN